MYKSFTICGVIPFEITPDPSFLFPTSRHKEALAALYYGVRRHKGFVVMTGEVGTGKTLLVRWLLQLLKGTNVAYAYVFNSRLSSLEFLQFLAGDFGLDTSGKTKSDLLLEFAQIPGHSASAEADDRAGGRRSPSSFGRSSGRSTLLTNLETAEEKLLQILLIGQPELDEKLDLVELRQLKQRIALRARLEPLDPAETSGYIERRLQMAGAEFEPSTLFPEDTVSEIYRYSRGIPRLINTICENALITAYARQLRSVPADIIHEVAKEFRLNLIHLPRTEKLTNHDRSESVAAKRLTCFSFAITRKARASEKSSHPQR